MSYPSPVYAVLGLAAESLKPAIACVGQSQPSMVVIGPWCTVLCLVDGPPHRLQCNPIMQRERFSSSQSPFWHIGWSEGGHCPPRYSRGWKGSKRTQRGSKRCRSGPGPTQSSVLWVQSHTGEDAFSTHFGSCSVGTEALRPRSRSRSRSRFRLQAVSVGTNGPNTRAFENRQRARDGQRRTNGPRNKPFWSAVVPIWVPSQGLPHVLLACLG